MSAIEYDFISKQDDMIQEEIRKKIKPGAIVRVHLKGLKGEGTSAFGGLVIARKHGNEAGATFTVRAIIAGVGVERIFPINSPAISKVEILSSPKKVHKSKLYFVRKMSGRKIRQRLGVSL